MSLLKKMKAFEVNETHPFSLQNSGLLHNLHVEIIVQILKYLTLNNFTEFIKIETHDLLPPNSSYTMTRCDFDELST